jgi:hypothetical protein
MYNELGREIVTKFEPDAGAKGVPFARLATRYAQLHA